MSGTVPDYDVNVTVAPLTGGRVRHFMRSDQLIYQLIQPFDLPSPNPIKMKPSFKTTLLAITGAAFLAGPAMGAVSLESGSLAVAFYQVIGGVVQNSTYTFDLGQASLYRQNTGYNVSVSTVNNGLTSSNIGADLTSAFGANWANDGTVRWMVVGNVGQSDATIGGDPARTSYLSRGASSLVEGEVTTTIPTLSSTNRGLLSNNIEPFLDGINGASQTVGANPGGAFVDKSAINTVEDFVPPTTLTYFGVGINPTQVLGAGTIGGYEGALDIYRVLHTATGADLTSGYGADATVGAGQYIGTLVLSSDGNLSVIPEPSAALLGLASLGLCFRRRRNA